MDKKHVHETNPKRTFVTVIIFIVVIVVGLLTIKSDTPIAERSHHQTIVVGLGKHTIAAGLYTGTAGDAVRASVDQKLPYFVAVARWGYFNLPRYLGIVGLL